jgi:hypothetical protein
MVGPVIPDYPMCHHCQNALVGGLLSRLPDKPGDRYPHVRFPDVTDRIEVRLVALEIKATRRSVDRHPLASIGSLVLGLRCSWCPGNAPIPVLTGLHAVPPAARWRKSTPMEFLHGRPLGPEDLEMIRRQIEEGAEVMAAVDNEIRGIVARNWPHLLAKLPPEED